MNPMGDHQPRISLTSSHTFLDNNVRNMNNPARVLVLRNVIGMSQIWNGSSLGNEPLLLAASVDLGGEPVEGLA